MSREGDAARAKVPDALSAHALTRETVLEGGLVERELKVLCARSLAGEDVEPANERERAALDWTYAVAWDADTADDALWQRLHAHLSEPELVELGYAIAYTLGQMHWLRTLGIREDPRAP
jgi:alkylhydroperoxidase family enzyme